MNILIKFSGEFFTPLDSLTQDGFEFLEQLEKSDVKKAYFVVGGGNRIRGKNSEYPNPVSDNLGVLSTIMNAIVLQENLKKINMNAVVFSHFHDFGKLYHAFDVLKEFQADNAVILASGLGRVGYVSTDLSSVIKSLELGVDMMIKVTRVDGIYDKDPTNSDARLLKRISYKEVLDKKLQFMDQAAVAIASENNLKIAVTNIENFAKFIQGEDVGSIVQ